MLRQMRGVVENSIYISADTLDRGDSIREIIAYFHDSMNINNFFIDEIHFVKNYYAELKELYDFYSGNISFSGLMLHHFP